MIFAPSQFYEAKDYLNQLFLVGKNASIKEFKKPRSLPQNNLLWLWMECISRETGNDRNWLKEYYQAKFLPTEIKIIRDRTGKEISRKEEPVGTSTLNTGEFKIFLDKIKLDALEIFDIDLPEPEEKRFAQFREYYEKFVL